MLPRFWDRPPDLVQFLAELEEPDACLHRDEPLVPVHGDYSIKIVQVNEPRCGARDIGGRVCTAHRNDAAAGDGREPHHFLDLDERPRPDVELW